MPSDLLKRVNWDLIYPPLVERIFDVVAACQARGSDYWAVNGFRSPEEQLALYAKGRNAAGAVTEPKKVVTKVKFGYHNLGLAVDFCRDGDIEKPALQPDYDVRHYALLAEEAESHGLEPGFRWKWQDAPHVQLALYKKGLTVDELRRLYQVKGIPEVWARLDKHGPW